MSTTTLLQITEVASNQNNKEVTINDAFVKIERSLNDILVLDFSGGDVTLNSSDATSYGVFVCTLAAAAANLIVPSSKRIFGVKNDSGSTITVKTATGTGTPVEDASRAVLFCDGTDAFYFASGAQPSSLFYDLGFQFMGLPLDGETQEFLAVRAFTLPAAGGGSLAKANAPATADATFSIKKNGTEVGIITFASSSSTGTFTVAADVAFAISDILSVVGPSPADTTLSDIVTTFACTR